jgi:predicted MFS family arabinose efflux permease
MSTTSLAEPPVRAAAPPWWTRRRLILILALFVFPIALSLATNSWGALTVESALRMHAGAIAGQTIGILGAVAALVVTFTHRRNMPGIVFFTLVLAAVVVSALSAMENAGAVLLDRFDTIAEVDLLD